MTAPFRVVVVGAGVGGVAGAIDLARAGCEVTVLERCGRAGGKMATVEVAGRSIDCGPTVLTMRWVFEELFADAGRSLDAYVRTEPAAVIARHAWPDGARLDLFADDDRSATAIREAFGPQEEAAFRVFRARTRAIYQAVEGPFLRSQRPTLGDALRQAQALGPSVLRRIDALRTMWTSIASTFGAPHLRQLFARYATYCGSSPFEAAATLNLIGYVEQLGVHRVVGGMHALADAMASVALELGVRFRLGAEVNRILVSNRRVGGVLLAEGGSLPCDAVLFNGDVSAISAGLLGAEVRGAVSRLRPERRSLSALTWATVARVDGLPLAHHTVLFSSDYSREFQSLLRDRRCPAEPTVYLCAQDRWELEASAVSGANERLLMVVNAPATGDDGDAWTDEEIERWERATFSTLNRCGLALTPLATRVTSPRDFARRFPATGGALYGARSRGALSPLSRPGSRSRVTGLYLAGGSVHPGPGIPMAALSGRLAARQILGDLASTRRSARAGTSGTMWTS